jgi:hypothetical protein
MAWYDMEDAKLGCLLISSDSEQGRPGTTDGDALADNELSGGECDGLSVEQGVELDRAAIRYVYQGLAERAGPTVVRIGNGDGGGLRLEILGGKKSGGAENY